MSAIRKSPITASAIDDEHRGLLVLIERLRAVLARSPMPGTAEPLCRQLAAQANAHFQHEERLMRRVSYPHRDWHARQHAAARARVAQLKRCVARGAGDPRAEIDRIGRWLDDHIHLSDRMLTAYVRNFERAHKRDILY